jgi:hypothetical protein
MSAFYNIVMYLLSFGLMTVIFGTMLGLAFWLMKVAWRIVMQAASRVAVRSGLKGIPCGRAFMGEIPTANFADSGPWHESAAASATV